MQSPVPHTIQKQHLWLSAERCIFWEDEKSLIVSDLHFGKTGHFRKSGIAVPQNVFKEDLQRLVAQIQHFQPKHLIVVGDFFHSNANKELELFKKWRENFPGISIHLIKGNHDILQEDWYTSCDIKLNEEEMKISNFTFIHDISHSTVKLQTVNCQLLFLRSHSPGNKNKRRGKTIIMFSLFLFRKEICCPSCIQPIYGSCID